MEQKMKIWVMAHKQCDLPKDPVYVPLHVGSALHEDLGYERDDSGDQISALNIYYGELTGQYWAARNVFDTDYMGLCHYRRFFLDPNNHIMSGEGYREVLSSCDIILPVAIRNTEPYYDTFQKAHNIKDLDVTGEALRKLYPEIYPVFREVMNSFEVHSSNMFVASTDLFREYTNWLFSIFDLAKKDIDVSGYDEYHRRVYGFLSEQLIFVWVKSKGLVYREIPVGLTREKAETSELKEALRDEIRKGDRECAKRALSIFRTQMENRPDVMLGASDLSGELEDMFRVLYVLDKELTEDPAGSMLGISTELDILVKHYRLLCQIKWNMMRKTASQEEIRYYRDSAVSDALNEQIESRMTMK